MNHCSKLLLGGVLLTALASVSCQPREGAFEHTDVNKDGKLSVAEIDAALAETVHVTADANGDGIVTFEEWQTVFPKADRKKFDKHNTDGKPGMTLAETTAALDKENVFDKLLAKIDTNGDGVVDKKEAGVFHDKFKAAKGNNDLQKLENIIES